MTDIKSKFDLSGKVAIVTGSSKGIGLSIAQGLAENGATAADKMLSAEGLDVEYVQLEVTDEAQVDALVQHLTTNYGKLDVLVNNAAINPFYGPLEATGEEVFDKIMDVNVKAPWLLSNLVQPHMKENGGGSIINISSVEGIHPGFRLGLYSMSKSALIMLTKNQAKEWGKLGIRANVVCPGLIKT